MLLFFSSSDLINTSVKVLPMEELSFATSALTLEQTYLIDISLESLPILTLSITLFEKYVKILGKCVECISIFWIYWRTYEPLSTSILKLGLKLYLEECNFGCSEVVCLGHMVSISDISSHPEKLQSVKLCAFPNNIREVKEFSWTM